MYFIYFVFFNFFNLLSKVQGIRYVIHAKYTALAYLQTPFIAAVNLLWCSSFPFIICYTECFNDPFMLAEFVSGSVP